MNAMQLRKQFEIHIRKQWKWKDRARVNGWLRRARSGRYHFLHIDAAWLAWQAAKGGLT